MSKIDDGGAAFPYADGVYANGQKAHGSSGMTLRDYFAAAAFPSIIAMKSYYDRKACEVHVKNGGLTWGEANTHTDAETMSSFAETCAITAYKYADRMLAARKEEAQ